MKKDYSDITLEEAITWTQTNCKYEDVRKKIKSRAVVSIMYSALLEAVRYIIVLEERIKELEVLVPTIKEDE